MSGPLILPKLAVESTRGSTLVLPSVGAEDGRKLPAVLIVHGFQGKKEFHIGTAERLADAGFACLCIDLLPLMSLNLKRRIELRAANVIHILAEWNRLAAHPRVDAANMCLAGHSAGGALAIESVCSMIETKQGKLPRALLLLDAVPWLSTLKRLDKYAKYFIAPLPGNVRGDHPADVVVVASFRGTPGRWNANGLVLEALARGFTGPCSDVRILHAGHGDFMYPAGGRFGCFMGFVLKLAGLTSSTRIQDDIEDLVVAFVESAVGGKLPEAFGNMASKLNKDIAINMVTSDSVKDMRSNLPSFLQ